MKTLLRIPRAPSRISIQLSSAFCKLPPTCRSFHASPQPRFLEGSIALAHSAFDGIHSFTGLPWSYSIPLGAFMIRATCILPFAIYSRRAIQQQMALSPLIHAWVPVLKKQTSREIGNLGPVIAQKTLQRKLKRKTKEIYRRWGCGKWKTYLPLIQIPIWLTAIEAIRAMCGSNKGLLGTLLSGEGASGELGASGVRKALQEPSLAFEGALWFPDLLVPDPHLVLPFVLSLTILLNLGNATSQRSSARQRGVARALRLLALAVGPLTLQVPSGLLIYWISSSALALGQAKLLERLMPTKPFVPCKPTGGQISFLK